MKSTVLAAMVLVCGLIGCGPINPQSPELTREQVLPSGKRVTIIDVHFAYGAKDNVGNDSFAVGYVASNPNGDPAANQAEATDVFELIRPVSEQWGLKVAEVSAFPTAKKNGSYVSYTFKRGADGKWSSSSMKGSIYSF